MEVLAVSHALPKEYNFQGLKIKSSILHDPLTAPTDYIELDENGVVDNATAAHEGPVYVMFAENYDYWCSNLGVERASWDWCHWGENITLRYKGQARLENEIQLGDIWRIGDSVRLEVCGSRIPCQKLSWRCGQKDSWLPTLAATGRVGVYLRVIQGGRVHPGDEAHLEAPSKSRDTVNVATITQVCYSASLKTKDTLDMLAKHKLLMRLNKLFVSQKLHLIEDKLNLEKNGWKGWRDLRVFKVVDEGWNIKSFYFQPLNDDEDKSLANYQPGQFLSIRLPKGTIRSWTISDFPCRDGPQYYRVTIKKGGVASTWMHDHCTPNTTLPARSPAGRFVLDWASGINPRQVYISAGIGITPMLAMLRAHALHPNFQSTPALIIHVAQNGASFPFQEEIAKLGIARSEKHIYFTLPRPSPDVQGVHYDHVGRPSMEALKEVLSAPYQWNPFGTSDQTVPCKMSKCYICGPADFEASIKSCLQEIGIPPPLIFSESFSASGAALGEVKRARVRFVKSNKTATWDREAPVSLLELAESLGLTPDYGCRVGACGSCKAKLNCGSVSGGVQMDGSVLTCAAVPASEEVEIDM
ncbi:pyruvate kinase-like protein [Pseudomassariella vexata]|uniref:Pyruvate kinase-like protein n=1 Tax=Pseudomassariella vexata TaxID=1141098 RepID=A0A1Y2DHB2_9PEZI|nr:pyruvate kinase-like protein [Pseudomassariella vexata]ORY58494.1 pyruvate kinase-like protein [Pseudomassariella vexata]